MATLTPKKFQIQPHWGQRAKHIQMCHNPGHNHNISAHMPHKLKDQSSPSVLTPYLQRPRHPIYDGWVCWLAQCEWIHQSRVFPPSNQPNSIPARHLAMHSAPIVHCYIRTPIQAYIHNPLQASIITSCTLNR